MFQNLAVNVFLGTLPLLFSIVWGLIQNDRRLNGIEKRLDRMDVRMDRIDARFDRIDAHLDIADGKLTLLNERAVRLETKLEGGRLVLAHD